MIEINKVTKFSEFKIIEKLANEILHEVYDPFIPSKYTDDFLNEFQSIKAIESQISNKKFSYYLLIFKTKTVGYLALQEDDDKLILSKFYILESFRGKKIGKVVFEFVIEFAKKNRLVNIELIVKKQNKEAAEIYLKKGFKIIETIVNYFPNGDSVEDYRMEKTL